MATDELPSKGDRVRLVSMTGDQDPIEPGSEGTVLHADPISVSVDWDNGRKLGLLPGVDEWLVL